MSFFNFLYSSFFNASGPGDFLFFKFFSLFSTCSSVISTFTSHLSVIQHPRQRVPPLPNLGDPRACVLLILADSRPFSCPRQTPFLAAYRTKSGFILLSIPSTLRCRWPHVEIPLGSVFTALRKWPFWRPGCVYRCCCCCCSYDAFSWYIISR